MAYKSPIRNRHYLFQITINLFLLLNLALAKRFQLVVIIFASNAGSTNGRGGNPADAGHHALAVLVPNVHLVGTQRFSIGPKHNQMRQRIEAKKKNYPYWFSSAALPARRLWRIPVDAQTVPRVNRPEEKMALLMISRSDIFILFHLQNTSFFLGFSRMPLSSAAMATIPLQKHENQ